MSWTLKVRDKFQAAHYLRGYKGKCEKIHGHTFQVEVEIGVGELDPTGIGIDFTDIKKRLTEVLPDHTLLNDVYPFNPPLHEDGVGRPLEKILRGSQEVWFSSI